MTNLPFLLFALSPFVLFDSDNPLILCQLCKSKTIWNIFIILGRKIEQDQTTIPTAPDYRVRKFWIYLVEMWNRTRQRVVYKNDNSAFLTFAVTFVIFDIDYALRSVSCIPFRTFSWYLVEMQNRTRRHITYKCDNSGFFSLELSPIVLFLKLI